MKEKGFTLIELLVVVGIIGILSAIAIPQFAEYRKNAYNASASSDLRNAATAEEAYYALNEEYRSCSNETCTTGDDALPGLKAISQSVNLTMTEDGDSFTGESYSDKGSKKFSWDSANGGMQEPEDM